jgi:hypothetical protein
MFTACWTCPKHWKDESLKRFLRHKLWFCHSSVSWNITEKFFPYEVWLCIGNPYFCRCNVTMLKWELMGFIKLFLVTSTVKANSLIACCVCAVPMPCRAHAMLWPCHSSQGHGTARPFRDGLWATWLCSASSGYHAELHEDFYQKHTNPPHNDPYLRL